MESNDCYGYVPSNHLSDSYPEDKWQDDEYFGSYHNLVSNLCDNRSNRPTVNLLKTNFREAAKLILIIRSSSYQDRVIHVQYYSKQTRLGNRSCLC